MFWKFIHWWVVKKKKRRQSGKKCFKSVVLRCAVLFLWYLYWTLSYLQCAAFFLMLCIWLICLLFCENLGEVLFCFIYKKEKFSNHVIHVMHISRTHSFYCIGIFRKKYHVIIWITRKIRYSDFYSMLQFW